MNSGEHIRLLKETMDMMITPSGKLQLIQEFLCPMPYTDEDGVKHVSSPLITIDQARELMDLPSLEDRNA